MHVPNRIEDKCVILLVFRKLLSDSSESFAERWSTLLFENLLFHCIESQNVIISGTRPSVDYSAPGEMELTSAVRSCDSVSVCVSNVGPIYWILNHGLSMVIFPSPLNLQLPIWNQEFSSWTRELVGSTNVKVKTSNGPEFQHFGHIYSDLNKPF